MKKLFSISLFLIVVISKIGYSQQTVIVDAATEWLNTGITINQGDILLMMAEGSWSYDGTNSFGTFVGPEGDEYWHQDPQEFIAQNVNHMSLVGRIGDTGTPFGIGSFYVSQATESGTLFLSMNDRSGGFSTNYGYMVVGIYINEIIVGIFNQTKTGIPATIQILQNYPNPFNPSTTIEYQISEASQVGIKIYDVNGQLVRVLLNDYKYPGNYSEIWDGKNNYGTHVSSGTYFYQLQAGDLIQTKKMILLK